MCGTGCAWNVRGSRSSVAGHAPSVAGARIYKGWVFVVWGSLLSFVLDTFIIGVFCISLCYVLKWIITMLDYICVYIVKTVNSVS